MLFKSFQIVPQNVFEKQVFLGKQLNEQMLTFI